MRSRSARTVPTARNVSSDNPPRPCRTQDLPLVGSAGETEVGIADLAAHDPALAAPLAPHLLALVGAKGGEIVVEIAVAGVEPMELLVGAGEEVGIGEGGAVGVATVVDDASVDALFTGPGQPAGVSTVGHHGDHLHR